MEEDGAVELMKEQPAKPEKDQEKPLILKAQRVTFKTRRKFTRSLEDATIKDITEKYMEKEFFLMKPDLSQKILEDKWTELLQHLDGIFHDAEVNDLKLSSKAKSPLRLVVALNENGSINNCFIIGDGVEISVGKDIKTAFQMLLMAYYIFDLSYLEKYQLLGFLQMAVVQDDASFFKGTNYLEIQKSVR